MRTGGTAGTTSLRALRIPADKGLGTNMLRKRLLVLAVVAVAAAGVLAGTALAIVGGAPDNNRHPYVGMAVYFPTGNPADGFELCSGSLVSPTVFVTAAHCAPSGAVVLVDMQEDAFADLHQPGFGSAVPGVVTQDSNFRLAPGGLSQSDRSDVAVVQLLAPVQLDRYAQLPAVGYDDTLPNNQKVDNVGYGLQDAKTQSGFGSRILAQQKVVPGGGATGADFLKVSSGTTCSGDSGGPNLQAGTDILLAINSYGPSATCNAVSYSQRLDTPEVHDFIAGFLD
jgi:secreted trypsin-like serine protease